MATSTQKKQSSVMFGPDLASLSDLAESEPPTTISSFMPSTKTLPMRRPGWLETTFVWVVSAMIHLILLLGILIAYHIVSKHFAAKAQPVIVPAAFFGGTVNSHHLQTENRQVDPARHIQKKILARFWSAAVSPTPLSALLHDGPHHHSALEIGLGAGGNTGAMAFSGNTALFGKLSGQIGSGPLTSFFGVESRARRVVYLIDTSGSMIGKLHLVKRAARKSLHALLPFQKFAVITFARHLRILGPTHLVPARPFYRRRIHAALQKIVAEGANDNMLRPFTRTFKAAFAMQPNVIYFLTDGHFDKRLIPYVARLEQSQRVQVCTFAFLDHDPVFQRRLKEIARETGGQYEYVSRRLLDNQ